ncbi:hypothetical protein C4577_05060 [Candidatus Parcubacteria bacterium]|nr:MAG: hypothetical protein C4577_05060 [Candidatus Parcubacteria bacterium]
MTKILDEVECLNWYDGPLISICNGDDGKLYYCHWSGCDKMQNIWMATPVSLEDIDLIKTGKVDIKSILTRPETKLFSDIDMVLTNDPIDPEGIPKAGITLFHKEDCNCGHSDSNGSK